MATKSLTSQITFKEQLSLIDNNNAQHALIANGRQQELWDIVVDEEKRSIDLLHQPDSLLDRQHSKRTPAIFSFFAGAGLLDLGFEHHGFKIAYVNEFYSPFLDAYRYARKHLDISTPEYGYYAGSAVDLTAGKQKNHLTELIKDARRTSDIIGFIGGPPCPDFSIGGKNRGHEGDNGKLSATYIELICQQRPDFYLFENVKGLWKTKRHRAFYEELKRITQEDYVTTEILANAIEYGTPQDRERIILLGFRKDLLTDITTRPVSSLSFPWERYAKYSAKNVFASRWPATNPFEENSSMPPLEGIIEELTVEFWFRRNEVINHPNAAQHFKPKAGLVRFASVPEGDDSKKSFKRLHRWRFSPTACYGNNEVHLHPYKIRRISVAEALAIQSLPKTFTLPQSMTLTDAFKAIGNGVPYLMAAALAQTILDFLGGLYDETDSIQYRFGNRTTAQEPHLPICQP